MSANSGYGAGGWPPQDGDRWPPEEPQDQGQPPGAPHPGQHGQPGQQYPAQQPSYPRYPYSPGPHSPSEPAYPAQQQQPPHPGPHQTGPQPPYPPQQPPAQQGPPQQPPYQTGPQPGYPPQQPPAQQGPPQQPPHPGPYQTGPQPGYPGQRPGYQGQPPQVPWQQGVPPGQPQPDWQQWTGGGQHRAPRRRSRKGLVLGLSGTGVLALVVVVVLFLFFWRSDAAYDQAWEIPRDKGAAALLDSYAVKDTLIRASATGITGQDVTNGKEAWTVKPPAGQQLCGVSPKASGNTIVYAYGRSAQCVSAAAIDLRTGKVLWKARLEEGQDYQKPATAAVTVVGGVAVFSNGRVTALDLKSGEQSWTVGPSNTKSCRAGDAMANDAVLLAYVDCAGRAESGADDVLVSLDPADGASVWQAKVKNEEGTAPPLLVNVSPPVLRLEDEKGKVEYASVDDQGENPVVFPAFDDGYAVGPAKVNGSHVRFRLAVQGDVLVGVSGGDTVVGVDVTTGKKQWEKRLGKQAVGSLVLGEAAKGELRVLTLNKTEQQEWLTTVDPATGKLSKGPVVRELSDDEVAAHEKRIESGFYLGSGDTLMEFAGQGDEDFAVRAYTPS